MNDPFVHADVPVKACTTWGAQTQIGERPTFIIPRDPEL